MAMFGRRQADAAQPAPAPQYDQSQVAVNPQTDVQIARAVLTPAVSTMISDGEISDWELAQLGNICAFSPIFHQIDQDTVSGMIRAVIDEIGVRGGLETIKRAADTLSPALRETAFCFAMRVGLADGHLADGERNALSHIGQAMDIEPEMFEQVLVVVAMMQRSATA